MVLESLINPKSAEKDPWRIFVVAFVYSLIASFFAWRIFPSEASLLTITFITILFVPFFQRIFVIEERRDKNPSGNIFTRHICAIYVYSAFFLGVIFSLAFIFVFAPDMNVFSLQTNTLKNMVSGTTVDSSYLFLKYFINNSQTMILSFILSIMFGAGAVFILAWNASIIAVYLGFNIRSLIGEGMHTMQAYLYGVPLGLGAIALHGVPEIAGYFLAGLAGGILSIGLLREKYGSIAFNAVVKDALIYLALAETLILIGAWLEAVF
ncbi:MAG: stage II sporulation protein M [Candidatus Aenigmarchaeota archaeon]|nr:stage II sporulation protein M [Candidatus Aenigmarchaeota archaeon]